MKHVVGAFIEMSAVVIPWPNKIKQKAGLNITALVQNIQLLVLYTFKSQNFAHMHNELQAQIICSVVFYGSR